MASISSLTYTSQHAVTINWGDGVTETWPAAPPPASNTAQHTYSGPGPWTVVLTDVVNGLSSSRQITCTTCDITGAALTATDAQAGSWSLGPLVNGAGDPVEVDWGDGTAPDTVNSGDTITHTYAPAAGPGPFTILVTDPVVPGCTASVTGGNDPANPGGGTVIVPPALTVACQAPSAQGEDVVAVTIAGPTGATYNITWNDGQVSNSVTNGTVTHTYALPAGTARTIDVVQIQTTATDTLAVTCDVAPLVSALACAYVPNCTKETTSPVHQSGTTPTQVTFGPASFNWNVDWGDGSSVELITAPATVTHTYATPAPGVTVRYSITFTSPTNSACTDSAQITITGA